MVDCLYLSDEWYKLVKAGWITFHIDNATSTAWMIAPK